MGLEFVYSRYFLPIQYGLEKVSYDFWKVSYGSGKVSDGLGKVSDGCWKGSDTVYCLLLPYSSLFLSVAA